jgi:hypothetical protein
MLVTNIIKSDLIGIPPRFKVLNESVYTSSLSEVQPSEINLRQINISAFEKILVIFAWIKFFMIFAAKLSFAEALLLEEGTNSRLVLWVISYDCSVYIFIFWHRLQQRGACKNSPILRLQKVVDDHYFTTATYFGNDYFWETAVIFTNDHTQF